MEVSNERKNRLRDEGGESQVDMQETKRVRLGSGDSIVKSDLDSSDNEQIVAASGFLTVELEEVKAVQDDLLKILDDSDPVNSSFHGLDSVMRSLEEEIHLPKPENEATTKFCGSTPDLGYLLGASDDELGIPPTVGLAEEDQNEVFNLQATSSSPAYGYEGISGLPGEISGYDLFDMGIDGDFGRLLGNDDDDVINRDFVALDGLFDYSDVASELAFWTKSLSGKVSERGFC